MSGENTRKYFMKSERLGFGVWTEADMDLAWGSGATRK